MVELQEENIESLHLPGEVLEVELEAVLGAVEETAAVIMVF